MDDTYGTWYMIFHKWRMCMALCARAVDASLHLCMLRAQVVLYQVCKSNRRYCILTHSLSSYGNVSNGNTHDCT